MKVIPNQTPPLPPLPPVDPDPHRKKPARRKQSLRRTADRADAPLLSGKKAGPPTPLRRWNFDEEGEMDEFGGRREGRGVKDGGGIVSARRLAAAMWRLQPPDVGSGKGDIGEERRRSRKGDDRLGFKISSHHESRGFGFEPKGQPKSPCSVNGPMNGYTCEPQASCKLSNNAMECVTKWDPIRPEKNKQPHDFELFDQKQNDIAMISTLQAELERVQRRVEELESDRRSSKKKLKQFLQKLSEEKSAWRSREHEKVRALINDIKADLAQERKKSQRLELTNSKLASELAEAKLAMKKSMQDFEEEKRNRELVEEVCDELAKEMGEDKAEVEALKAECIKMREEADDERKMLQMAEVWREERVQMKLIDAKVSLEDKYSEMKCLVEYLQRFLESEGSALDIRAIKEAEMLQQAAASVNIRDLEEFRYVPPKSDDIFEILEEMAMGSQDDVDLDDDRSGWETASRADDQGSGFSCKEGDEMPASEVCSVRSKRSRKVSSVDNGESCKIVSVDDGTNGRLSNGQWSSPETGKNPHVGKGRKGCIEWPRAHKHSLKAKLLEARVESQKIQLRQVLKQKI